MKTQISSQIYPEIYKKKNKQNIELCNEQFTDCLKRERDILLNPCYAAEKQHSVYPSLKTNFSRNLIRIRHQANRCQEIHKLNTSARIVNEKSNFMK